MRLAPPRHSAFRPARNRLWMVWLGCAALAILAGTGCIERKILIVTDPPNVQVDLDGRRLGATTLTSREEIAEQFDLELVPGAADDPENADRRSAEGTDWIAAEGPPLGYIAISFDHYASFEIVLTTEDGHASQRHVVTPAIPAYEFFPLDFIFDVLLPVTFRKTHIYRFTLVPRDADTEDASDALYDRAVAIRDRASDTVANAPAEGDADPALTSPDAAESTPPPASDE